MKCLIFSQIIINFFNQILFSIYFLDSILMVLLNINNQKHL